jgi:hypothetical protein
MERFRAITELVSEYGPEGRRFKTVLHFTPVILIELSSYFVITVDPGMSK